MLPIGLVEWHHLLIDTIGDTSYYFVWGGYSGRYNRFGFYDSSGFGPINYEASIALAIIWVTVAVVLIASNLALSRQMLSVRTNFIIAFLCLLAQIVVPLAVFTMALSPYFATTFAAPLPVPSILQIAYYLFSAFSQKVKAQPLNESLAMS
jgi:heme/copper-type cytochrome/quinol oxidase subunit 1